MNVLNQLSSLIPIVIGAVPMLGLGAFLFFAVRFSKRRARYSKFANLAKGDAILIENAIAQAGEVPGRAAYLEVTVALELERLTREYLSTDRKRLILGSIYLIAGFFSIAITGTDLSLFGVLNTVKFSFAVNIIGEVASGFLIFGGFELKAAASHKLASLIRFEVGQFVACSAEYNGIGVDRRWFLFTESIDALLLGAIQSPVAPLEKEESEDAESN